jgi:uncharacterized protein YgiM (DUF1202 family)
MFEQTKITGSKLLFATLLLFYLPNSFADSGDELVINGDLVNFRAAPSSKSKIITKLPRGSKLIEIQRQNEWIEVETGRKNIKTGWVHDSLLSREMETGNVGAPRAAGSVNLFNKFRKIFNSQKENIKNEDGAIYFAQARFESETTIGVIATEAWFISASEERENALSKVLDIWNELNPDC